MADNPRVTAPKPLPAGIPAPAAAPKWSDTFFGPSVLPSAPSAPLRSKPVLVNAPGTAVQFVTPMYEPTRGKLLFPARPAPPGPPANPGPARRGVPAPVPQAMPAGPVPARTRAPMDAFPLPNLTAGNPNPKRWEYYPTLKPLLMGGQGEWIDTIPKPPPSRARAVQLVASPALNWNIYRAEYAAARAKGMSEAAARSWAEGERRASVVEARLQEKVGTRPGKAEALGWFGANYGGRGPDIKR